MKTSRIGYPYEIRPLSREEGGGYIITFPDLPGCRSDGATPEDAMRNGRNVLRSWPAVAHESGCRIPEPSAAAGREYRRES